ncbi:MAG: ATP-binding protein [Chitinophagaceae bacterium]|nr:ATP-binding protein [Chitinophagaceae bacterium]
MRRIVVIGPESTGKSTLCARLAEHYKTAWVPEYARHFLEVNGTAYTYDTLLEIAKGQVREEDAIAKKMPGVQTQLSAPVSKTPGLLFVDTDLYVIKVWSEFVFGKCHSWILNQIAVRKYDLYLLCNVDLPWIKDALREYPDPATRKKLYFFYKDIMVNQSLSWIDIRGSYDQRFTIAKDGINHYFN